VSNLFKPPANGTTPPARIDFADRWGSPGSNAGEPPHDFADAYRRYGGLPNDPGLSDGPVLGNYTGDLSPNALGQLPDRNSRLVGLRPGPKNGAGRRPGPPAAPGRIPYGVAPRADSFVAPHSNDPRDFVAPRDNPDVNQDALDFVQARQGFLPATLRNNNPGAISNSTKRGGYRGDNRPPAEDGWYTRFNTPEQGIHAQSETLRDYGRRGLNSPAAITNDWATGDSKPYAAFIATQLGVTPDARLDLEDPHVREQFLRAAGRWEAGLTGKGAPAPYKDDAYRRSVAGFFGKPGG
jgi:hypothetical protein